MTSSALRKPAKPVYRAGRHPTVKMDENPEELFTQWYGQKSKVPVKFLRAMERIGCSMGKAIGIYFGRELVASSEMWELAVPHFLSMLQGIRLQVSYTLVPRDDDPLYKASIDPLIRTKRSHVHEVEDLICRGPYAYVKGSLPCYSDVAQAIGLVYALMNPSEDELPLTHAAPDGAYLLTLQLHFVNMWMNIRIHRRCRG